MADKSLEQLIQEVGLTLTRRPSIVFIRDGRSEAHPHIIYICTIKNEQSGMALQVTTSEEWASMSDILYELLRTFDEFEYPDWVSDLEEEHGSQVARHARTALETRDIELENLLGSKFDQFLAAVKDI